MKFPIVLTGASLAVAAVVVASCSHELPQVGLDSGMGLHFNQNAGVATLAYGPANSDDVGLMLQCQAGSRHVDVSDIARSRSARSLILSSGQARTELAARLDASTGQPTLWASASMDAPALKAFRQSGRISVAGTGGRYSLTASPQEQAGVEAFFRSCGSKA